MKIGQLKLMYSWHALSRIIAKVLILNTVQNLWNTDRCIIFDIS